MKDMTVRDTLEILEQTQYGMNLVLHGNSARVMTANKGVDALFAPPVHSVFGKINMRTRRFQCIRSHTEVHGSYVGQSQDTFSVRQKDERTV